MIQRLLEHHILQISYWKTNHLRPLFGICYGKIAQLDQEDYHLLHYYLVYTEDFHAKLCQMPLTSLGRQRKL